MQRSPRSFGYLFPHTGVFSSFPGSVSELETFLRRSAGAVPRVQVKGTADCKLLTLMLCISSPSSPPFLLRGHWM